MAGRKFDRIVSGIAGGTEVRLLFRIAAGSQHPFLTQISQRVRFDVFAGLLNRVGSSDQLSLVGGVDAVIAGRDRGRAGDAHVYLGGTSRPHHLHDLPAGCSANDRIVYQHHTLTSQKILDWIQLDPHAKVSDGLFGLDEGASDIVVSNQAKLELQTTFPREPESGSHTGIGNGHHNVGLDWLFLCQVLPQQIATLIHRPSKDLAVWPREIYVLENAKRRWCRGEHPARLDTVFGEDQHLTWFYFALELSIDKVKGASFRTDNRRTIQPSETKRSKAPWIAYHDHLLFGQDNQ